jgi:hypothetical protein
MKIFISIIITIVFTTSVSAQYRECDLSVRFETPSEGDTVNALTYLPYSFWIVNKGVDSIYATDTIVYQLASNFAEGDKIKRLVSIDLGVGDSVLISNSFYFEKDIDYKKLGFFFSGHLVIYSPVGASRPLFPEVSPNTRDNSDYVNIVYLRNTARVTPSEELKSILVYPNPVVEDYVMLRGVTTEDFKIMVYNSIGEKLSCESSISREGTVRLDLTLLTRGMYYLDIYNGNSFSTSKLLKL